MLLTVVVTFAISIAVTHIYLSRSIDARTLDSQYNVHKITLQLDNNAQAQAWR